MPTPNFTQVPLTFSQREELLDVMFKNSRATQGYNPQGNLSRYTFQNGEYFDYRGKEDIYAIADRLAVDLVGMPAEFTKLDGLAAIQSHHKYFQVLFEYSQLKSDMLREEPAIFVKDFIDELSKFNIVLNVDQPEQIIESVFSLPVNKELEQATYNARYDDKSRNTWVSGVMNSLAKVGVEPINTQLYPRLSSEIPAHLTQDPKHPYALSDSNSVRTLLTNVAKRVLKNNLGVRAFVKAIHQVANSRNLSLQKDISSTDKQQHSTFISPEVVKPLMHFFKAVATSDTSLVEESLKNISMGVSPLTARMDGRVFPVLSKQTNRRWEMYKDTFDQRMQALQLRGKISAVSLNTIDSAHQLIKSELLAVDDPLAIIAIMNIAQVSITKDVMKGNVEKLKVVISSYVPIKEKPDPTSIIKLKESLDVLLEHTKKENSELQSIVKSSVDEIITALNMPAKKDDYQKLEESISRALLNESARVYSNTISIINDAPEPESKLDKKVKKYIDDASKPNNVSSVNDVIDFTVTAIFSEHYVNTVIPRIISSQEFQLENVPGEIPDAADDASIEPAPQVVPDAVDEPPVKPEVQVVPDAVDESPVEPEVQVVPETVDEAPTEPEQQVNIANVTLVQMKHHHQALSDLYDNIVEMAFKGDELVLPDALEWFQKRWDERVGDIASLSDELALKALTEQSFIFSNVIGKGRKKLDNWHLNSIDVNLQWADLEKDIGSLRNSFEELEPKELTVRLNAILDEAVGAIMLPDKTIYDNADSGDVERIRHDLASLRKTLPFNTEALEVTIPEWIETHEKYHHVAKQWLALIEKHPNAQNALEVHWNKVWGRVTPLNQDNMFTALQTMNMVLSSDDEVEVILESKFEVGSNKSLKQLQSIRCGEGFEVAIPHIEINISKPETVLEIAPDAPTARKIA
jgi:hypothetical protein